MSDSNIIKILPYYRYVANPWDKVGNSFNGSVTPGSSMDPRINKNCFFYGLTFYRPDDDDEKHDDAWFEVYIYDTAGKPDKSKQWLQRPPRCQNVPQDFVNPLFNEDDRGTTNYTGFYKTNEFPGTESGLQALNDWLDEEYSKYKSNALDKIVILY